MAFIPSTDVKETVLRETVYGTLPVAGNRYELPRKAGASFLTKDYGAITSDTIRPGRNANGSRAGNQSVSGTLELNAITADVVDLLTESALSGEYTNGVLKGGEKDVSFSHVAQIAANEFDANTGCMVTGFTLSATAAEAVTYSFDVMGSKQEVKTSIPGPFTVVPVPDEAYEYNGAELLNVTVAGAETLKYTSLELVVNQARNQRNVLSSNASVGLSVSGAREVTLTLRIYRETGVDYEALFTGEKQEFSFDLGIAGYGRKWTVFGQASSQATESEDDLIKVVTITGAHDTVEGTAIKVEKLD